MRRTTAGVNYFRLYSPTSTTRITEEENGGRTSRTAESTLQEITTDNAILRESDKVQEKTFDIELKEDICVMRPDTKLVTVDILGIDEAGASSKYKKYVSDKWHTFDCVIVVVDGRQGVNTDEQVKLLEFVNEKGLQTKDVPVIILCNKVDDPDNEEQQVLVDEAQQVVERIFKVISRKTALGQVLSKANDVQQPFPMFIPISAIHGFIYQSSSLMSEHQFQKFDKSLVDKIGKENLGVQWKRLSQDEKLTKAFQVVNNPTQCREALALCNFDKFLTVEVKKINYPCSTSKSKWPRRVFRMNIVWPTNSKLF
jgi:GTPase SAR1 family protein